MNAALNELHPLPAALVNGKGDAGRRHRIGTFDLDNGALAHFNRLLSILDDGHRPLVPDQLATAARELDGEPAGRQAPACITQRMRRAGVIELMLRDAEWAMPDAAREPAELVVAYVRGATDLIPDRLPRVGRLDDAIVVDAAWDSLAREVADFIEFRRLRRAEWLLAGMRARFDRRDWVEARAAQARLAEARVGRGDGSYVPRPVDVFVVH
ncbi:hypothetical protein GCM10028862_04430 [Luteimonas pelagia]